MADVRFLDTGEVRLRCLDFGGSGPPVLLLHGLCGTADEWAEVGTWLRDRAHVVAFDQRGHGQSTRRPGDVSQQAFVRDAASVIASLNLVDAIVVGQSMGGRTALLLAAAHPHVVRGLVLIEASPAQNPAAVESLGQLLAKWPSSFGSRKEAEGFFAGPGLTAAAYVANLAEDDGRFRPQFDADVMLEAIHDVADSDYWDWWKRVQAPTLVVGAENGTIPRTDYARMLMRNQNATFREIGGAGHDVHLERPEELKDLVAQFLDERVPQAGGLS